MRQPSTAGRMSGITLLAVLAIVGGLLGFWLGGARNPPPAPPAGTSPGAPASTTPVTAPPLPPPTTARYGVEAVPPRPPRARRTTPAAQQPRLPRAFRENARTALDRHIAQAGLQLGEADRQQLLSELARFWRSARIRERLPLSARPQLERRTQQLRDADQIFRQKLGIGLTQFVALYSPTGKIEDIGTTPGTAPPPS
jgi:hypothetical protein